MNRLAEYVSWVHENPRKCCKWVKLAVKRYENDLKRVGSESFPYVFDEKKAAKFIRFTEQLKQYKDVWAGKALHHCSSSAMSMWASCAIFLSLIRKCKDSVRKRAP